MYFIENSSNESQYTQTVATIVWLTSHFTIGDVYFRYLIFYTALQ